jgi:uncharacterized RDD family membrane protein YckC
VSAGAGAPHTDASTAATPSIRRRLAALLYEGVLLFGVLMISGWLYSTLTQQRNALQGKTSMQAFLFVVLGIYFGWFWSRGGQTVAMKAWHIRVVTRDGEPLSQARALVRYLLSWLWFLPSLAAMYLAGLHSGAAIYGALAAGVAAYAALAWLQPDRQFWHDAVCGTRLINWQPALPIRNATSA